MGNITNFPAPRERWHITFDTNRREEDARCFYADEHGPYYGVMIDTPSIDQIPKLVEKAYSLLKKEKATRKQNGGT